MKVVKPDPAPVISSLYAFSFGSSLSTLTRYCANNVDIPDSFFIPRTSTPTLVALSNALAKSSYAVCLSVAGLLTPVVFRSVRAIFFMSLDLPLQVLQLLLRPSLLAVVVFPLIALVSHRFFGLQAFIFLFLHLVLILVGT